MGVFMAALVDDMAFDAAALDLLRGIPLNSSASGAPKGATWELPDLYKFAEIKGSCHEKGCEKLDSKAHVCVVIDKSNYFLNDVDEEDVVITKHKYPVYDARKLIGELEVGQYFCWLKDPGKTIVHLNMHRPAIFNAEAGKYYYLDAKYGRGNTWVYSEITAAESKSVLATYQVKELGS